MPKWHLTLTHLYSYPTLMTWQVSYRFSSPSPLSTAWIFVQPFLSPRPGCFPDDLTKSFPKTGSIRCSELFQWISSNWPPQQKTHAFQLDSPPLNSTTKSRGSMLLPVALALPPPFLEVLPHWGALGAQRSGLRVGGQVWECPSDPSATAVFKLTVTLMVTKHTREPLIP